MVAIALAGLFALSSLPMTLMLRISAIHCFRPASLTLRHRQLRARCADSGSLRHPIDLPFGFLTTYVPMIYGVVIGVLAAYAGGYFDSILMRVVDVTVAFPFLVLIIVILAILGPGIQNIYLAIFLTA